MKYIAMKNAHYALYRIALGTLIRSRINCKTYFIVSQTLFEESLPMAVRHSGTALFLIDVDRQC